MKCLNCRKNNAILDPTFGYLPCSICQLKQSRLKRPGKIIEFTSESIKKERKEYAKDIIQPHRGGQLSKEWLDVYGPQAAKNRGFTDKEIREAKPVWNGDVTYYGDK